jgi:Tfp pilus assembly protein PilV
VVICENLRPIKFIEVCVALFPLTVGVLALISLQPSGLAGERRRDHREPECNPPGVF